MLSHEMICEIIRNVAVDYPLRRVSYFGSYASGTNTAYSDLDVLVEFDTTAVSLLLLANLKHRLEDELSIPVDIIHAPIPENSLIRIDQVVHVYER